MESILLGVQVVVAIALIVIVLVQRSENDGFGLGSGGGGMGVMSGRAKASFMTRTTAILAAVFMVNSLLLTIVVTGKSNSTLLDKIEAQPATPTVPLEGSTSAPAPVVPLEGAAAPTSSVPSVSVEGNVEAPIKESDNPIVQKMRAMEEKSPEAPKVAPAANDAAPVVPAKPSTGVPLAD